MLFLKRRAFLMENIQELHTTHTNRYRVAAHTPPYITDELAHLLATNQADSIMGSFGITRSEACSMVQAVFDVSDYSGKATVDANYAELWAALESEFRVLSEQGCEYTNCKFSDGIIILLK